MPRSSVSEEWSSVISEKPQKFSVYFFFSLVIHGIIIFLLTLLVVRKDLWDPQKRIATRILAEERVEKLAEHIKDRNIEELRSNVRNILSIKEEMDGLLKDDANTYSTFLRQQQQAIRGREPVLQQMAAIKNALQIVTRDWNELLSIYQEKLEPAALPNLLNDGKKGEMMETVNKKKGFIISRLLEAEEVLSELIHTASWVFNETVIQELRAFNKMEMDARLQMTQLQAIFEQIPQQLRRLKQTIDDKSKQEEHVHNYQNQIDKSKENIRKLVEQLNQDKAELENLKLKEKEGVEQLQTAQNAYQQAEKEKKDRKTLNTLQQNQKNASQKLESIRKEINQVMGRIGKTNASIKKEEESINQLTNKLKEAREKMDKHGAEIKEMEAALKEMQNNLKTGGIANLRLYETLTQKFDELFSRMQQPNSLRSHQSFILPQVLPSVLSWNQIDLLNLAQLYESADKLEKQVVETYKIIKGTRLALLRGFTLETAILYIDIPKPERAKISEEKLIGKPKTAEELEEQKAAIRLALEEGDRMEAYCRSLLEALKELKEEEQGVDLVSMTEETPQPEDQFQELQRDVREKAVYMDQILEALKELHQVIDKSETLTEIKQDIPKIAQQYDLPQLLVTKIEQKMDEVVQNQESKQPEQSELAKQGDLAKLSAEQKGGLHQAIDQAVTEFMGSLVSSEELGKQAQVSFSALSQQNLSSGKQNMKESQKGVEGNRIGSDMEGSLAKMSVMGALAGGHIAKALDISKLMKMSGQQVARTLGKGSPSTIGMRKIVIPSLEEQKREGQKITEDMVKKFAKIPERVPPLQRDTPGMRWGRMISRQEGVPTSWLIVDSWYVIGPWDNPNRVNIDHKFPPENVVDLDAVYVGKNGKQLMWQWVQATDEWHPSVIIPPDAQPYAIYYFYTEVYCEEEMDVWIATGSDDKSKIWINDMLIWESAPWHKNWQIDEGFRKVHLQKGRNRILYRLENGHLGTGMSFLIRVAPWEE